MALCRGSRRKQWHLCEGRGSDLLCAVSHCQPLCDQSRHHAAAATSAAWDLQPGQELSRDDASWLTAGRIVEEIDADAMLERGVHPIGKIRETVGALGPGESRGVAQFVPPPTADRDFAARRGSCSQFLAGSNAPNLVWKACVRRPNSSIARHQRLRFGRRSRFTAPHRTAALRAGGPTNPYNV